MYLRPTTPDPHIQMQFSNNEKGLGFIAIHPEKGAFLGIDEDKEAIFLSIGDLEPDQQIPVFSAAGGASGACADISILECTLYKVEGVARDEHRTVLAKDVIDTDGQVITSNQGYYGPEIPMDNSRLSQHFHKAVHWAFGWMGNTATYKKPGGPK